MAKGPRRLLGIVSGLVWGFGAAVVLQQTGLRHFDPMLVYGLPAGAALLSGIWAGRGHRRGGALALLLAPLLLSQGQECFATIQESGRAQQDLSGRGAGDPARLSEDFEGFTVLIEVPDEGDADVWVEFGGIHVTVGTGRAREGSYREDVRRSDLGPFSAPGLYRVGGTVEGVCSAEGFIEIQGSPWSNPIGQAGIGAVALGLLGTWFAGRRPPSGPKRPEGADVPQRGDATDRGDGEAPMPAEPGSFRPPRIRALLVEETTGRGLTGFVAGTTHRIEARLDAAATEWAERARLDDGLSRDVTIALTEPNLLHEPQFRVVPRVGAAGSESAAFALHVPSGTSAVDARLIALDGNRVLHTVRLPSRVAEPSRIEAPASGAADVAHLETTVASVPTQPTARPVDVALIVNHSNGTARVTALSDDRGAVVDVDSGDVAEAVRKIRGRLGEIVSQPEAFEALEDPGTVELLVFLAYHGRLLRNALTSDYLGESMAEARVLQVVSATPDAYFPFEFAYDFPAPAEDAGLCPQAAAALDNDDALGPCPAEHSSQTVCPLGFWGMSRIIERHAHQPGERLPAGFLLRSVPRAGRGRLPEGPVLVAASDRVDAVAAGTSRRLAMSLRAQHEQVAEAETWDGWIDSVASGRALAILLAHTVYSDTLDTYGLEIGASDQRWAADIDARFVPPENRPVIVALLGCDTAAAGEVSYERFPGLFRRAGAEVVLGTLTEMLGRHAAPIAEVLGELIARGWRHGPLRMGEVMVEFRRRLVADGVVAALAVTAFGDADWELGPANPDRGAE